MIFPARGRMLRRSLMILVGVLFVALVVVYLWLQSTLPDYARTLESDQLKDSVRIERDRLGVPHIHAQHFSDAAFALGYVQAQDRLWQMETIRRAVQGRNAELLGEVLLEMDVVNRAHLGLPRVSEKSAARMDPETRAVFQSFADGVNFAIASGEGTRSPEWKILGVTPDPWTAADISNMVIVISDTATDGERELRVAAMERDLPKALKDFALEPLGPDFPTLYEDFWAANSQRVRDAGGVTPTAPASRSLGGGYADSQKLTGTNFFLFGPEITASGKAILAVDPHLPTHSPSVIYPVRISLPDDFIAGGTWVGTPAVVFGQNSHIAWGMTHLYADTFDYIAERIDPDDPSRYLTPEGPRSFQTTTVSVVLRGGETRNIVLRSTHRGPVVSDALVAGGERDSVFAERHALVESLFGPGHVLVRRDVPSDDGYATMQALLNVSRARNWEEFRTALRDYEWSNNVAFADTRGNIGVQMAAKLPRRKQVHGWNGQRIARGWMGEGEWEGYVAFDELPYIFNPPQGWAADSNSRAVNADHAFRVSDNFSPPWRVMRAYELIPAMAPHTVDSVARIQLDVRSVKAAGLSARLLRINSRSEVVAKVQAMLAAWDFDMVADRPEPLLYSAIETVLQERLLNTRDEALAKKTPDTLMLLRAIDTLPQWCDDPETAPVENCEDTLSSAIHDAVLALEAAFGDNWHEWRWGSVHSAVFSANYSWRYMPYLGELTATRVVTPGGQGVLNQGSVVTRRAPMDDLLRDMEFDQKHGATFRLIADLGDPEKSRMAFAPGISANAVSPHWSDAARGWAVGDYEKLLGDEHIDGPVTVIRAKTR